MMQAFATADDLAALLGVEYTEQEKVQVTALLESASDYLRGVIGQEVFPRRTVTYTGYPSGGREDLPQWPVLSVDAVERDGATVPFTYRPGFIMVGSDDPVDVTFTFGFAEAPGELRRLTCVLAVDALSMLETTGAMSAGGLSSVAIDDFRAAFANGGADTGIALPEIQKRAVCSQFGRGGIHMVEASW